MLRAKRRALAKLDKVMVAHELTPRDPDGPVEAPPTLEQACRQGKAQEERNAAAYLEAYERVEVRRTAKLMDKLERSTRRSHVRGFGRCPRGG